MGKQGAPDLPHFDDRFHEWAGEGHLVEAQSSVLKYMFQSDEWSASGSGNDAVAISSAAYQVSASLYA